MTEQGLLFRGCLADARDDALGYDQKMNRGLRLDIMENDTEIVLVLDPSRDLSRNNPFEEGRHGGWSRGATHRMTSFL
jgi:hypothetical protein